MLPTGLLAWFTAFGVEPKAPLNPHLSVRAQVNVMPQARFDSMSNLGFDGSAHWRDMTGGREATDIEAKYLR